MKSTKYQLLKADFDLALKDIRLRNERIKQLEEELEEWKKQTRYIAGKDHYRDIEANVYELYKCQQCGHEQAYCNDCV
jgi:flagellar motility protein MotE (MotC chaperone)